MMNSTPCSTSSPASGRFISIHSWWRVRSTNAREIELFDVERSSISSPTGSPASDGSCGSRHPPASAPARSPSTGRGWRSACVQVRSGTSDSPSAVRARGQLDRGAGSDPPWRGDACVAGPAYAASSTEWSVETPVTRSGHGEVVGPFVACDGKSSGRSSTRSSAPLADALNRRAVRRRYQGSPWTGWVPPVTVSSPVPTGALQAAHTVSG